MRGGGTWKLLIIALMTVKNWRWLIPLAIFCNSCAAQGQKAEKSDGRVTVRFSDVRQAAGITFLQDATQTQEKYYLETMGTGVAWLDYDQD